MPADRGQAKTAQDTTSIDEKNELGTTLEQVSTEALDLQAQSTRLFCCRSRVAFPSRCNSFIREDHKPKRHELNGKRKSRTLEQHSPSGSSSRKYSSEGQSYCAYAIAVRGTHFSKSIGGPSAAVTSEFLESHTLTINNSSESPNVPRSSHDSSPTPDRTHGLKDDKSTTAKEVICARRTPIFAGNGLASSCLPSSRNSLIPSPTVYAGVECSQEMKDKFGHMDDVLSKDYRILTWSMQAMFHKQTGRELISLRRNSVYTEN